MDSDTLQAKKGHPSTKCCEVCETQITSHHKYWQCRSLHNTCHTCVADCIDSNGLVRCPRQDCGEKLDAGKFEQTEGKGGVYIYVDDSNMWIEAKKLASKRLKLKTREDPRVRFDIGKVTDVVARSREVVQGMLYGSEPPTIDSVWRKIKEHGWTVVTTKSSSFNHKQKQVDQQLVADVTELTANASIQKGMIIIISGDADVIPAIKAGLKKKWKFEIWAWRSGMSNSLKAMERENPECVEVVQLDEYLHDITFTNFRFNMAKFEPHLKSQTAVITNVTFNPTEGWEKELSEQLRWPFQFCWIGGKRQDPNEYRDIILVFASVKAEDGGNAKEHFDMTFQRLKELYGEQATTYPVYQQKYHRKSELIISNRFEKLAVLDNQLCNAVEGDSSDEEVSSITQAAAAATVIGLPRRESFPLYCSGYGSLPSDNTSCPSTPMSRATSRSSMDSPFQDFSSNGGPNGNHGTFRTVVPRRVRKTSQKFSEACKFQSRCRYGLKCHNYHSEGEKEFFKNRKRGTMCHFGRHCNRRPKCDFAHSNKEAFCCQCHKWGHVKENCGKES